MLFRKFLAWLVGHPVKGQTVYYEQKSSFWTSNEIGVARIVEVRDSCYRYRYKVVNSNGKISHVALEDIEKVQND